MSGRDPAPVVIVGAGSHARVVLDVLRSARRPVLGFLDDNPALHGTEVLGLPVLGATDHAPALQRRGAMFLVGVADNVVRGLLVKRLQALGAALAAAAVHPRAVIAVDVALEDGVVVMPGVVVNTGARLERGSLANTNASVDHDCVLGEGAQAMPGAVLTGAVVVERYATVGSGAVVVPMKRVGENAYVGAGAVVLDDVPANAVVVGVPARLLRYRPTLESRGL